MIELWMWVGILTISTIFCLSFWRWGSDGSDDGVWAGVFLFFAWPLVVVWFAAGGLITLLLWLAEKVRKK